MTTDVAQMRKIVPSGNQELGNQESGNQKEQTNNG